MIDQSKEVYLTKEQSEMVGRRTDAKNAQYEQTEVITGEADLTVPPVSAPLTESEIIQRVGEQNYKNMKVDRSMGSINS